MLSTEQQKSAQNSPAFLDGWQLSDGSAAQLETVLDMLPVPVILIRAADQVFIFLNKHAREMYGPRHVDFILHTPMRERRYANPDGTFCPMERVPVVRSLLNGEVVRGEELVLEFPWGSPIPVSISSAPLYNSQGRIFAAVAVFEDITAEKRRRGNAALMSQLTQSLSVLEIPKDILKAAGERLADRFPGVHIALCQADEAADKLRVLLTSVKSLLPEGFSQKLSRLFPEETLAQLRRGRAVVDANLGLLAPCADGGQLDFLIVAQQAGANPWLKEEAELMTLLSEQVCHRLKRAQAEEERNFLAGLMTMVDEAIVAINAEHIVTYWNEPARELFGWSASQAVGQSIMSLIRGGIPDERYEEAMDQAARNGFYHGELVFCREDGEKIPVETHIKILRRKDGELTCAIASFRDITQHKAAEDALRENEARAQAMARELEELRDRLTYKVEALRRLHAISSRFICQEDLQGIYGEILSAAMELTSADMGEIQQFSQDGKSLQLLAFQGPEGFAGGAGCPLSGLVLSRREQVLVEDIATCPLLTGTPDLARLQALGVRSAAAMPMFASTGRLAGVLCTFYKGTHQLANREEPVLALLTRHAADVLERGQMEQALRTQSEQLQKQAQALEKDSKLITDFFVNVSHEFKTPLSILLISLDLMEQEAREGSQGKGLQYITSMRQNAYRLMRLVGNLLDISKLDAGFMQPKWENCDVVALARDIVKSTELFASQKGLQLRFSGSAPGRHMVTDRFMLERILLNLLSNAIKHTNAGGHIDVTLLYGSQKVTLSVKDDGEGIPENRKGLIFDRFRQANTSLSRRSEGCGIGLALTKSMVELMGGWISFDSIQGLGSEFIVELPASRDQKGCIPLEQGGMQLEQRVQMELSDIGGE